VDTFPFALGEYIILLQPYRVPMRIRERTFKIFRFRVAL